MQLYNKPDVSSLDKMPLATAHLIALAPQVTPATFLKELRHASIEPLVASRVVRWIIKPEKLSATRLLSVKWDILLILPASTKLPESLRDERWISHHWLISAGVPSSLVNGFRDRNQRLLHPQPGDVPALTGALNRPKMASSAQGLELSDELLTWSKNSNIGDLGAVSMLNLLSFFPTKEAHDSYLVYGKAFAQSIGSRRGGNAKIVGKVVRDISAGEDKYGWDEIALAHYPSINHFVDMLASEDYQKVNHESRLPALRDTCILCTSELHPDLTEDSAKL